MGKSANPERVLPSMAMETVGETVLPAAVEAVGMAETIDEKAVSGKSGRKKPENMLEALQCFLTARYDFRYNLLTEQTEYRGKEMPDEEYFPDGTIIKNSSIFFNLIIFTCISFFYKMSKSEKKVRIRQTLSNSYLSPL